MIQAKRAHVKEGKKGRNWLRLLALGVGVYLAWTLGKGVLELKLAYKRIDEARQILALEQARGEELKRKWVEVQTQEYLEKVARNDLNMQKEGETVVVLTNQPASMKSLDEVKEEKELPNWGKWWNLVK